MTEPSRLSWTIRFGGLLEAVNGSEIDPTGRAQFLELLEEAKKSGNFVDLDANTEDGVWHDQLVCDCTAMHISDAEGHTLATVPLHQIASVGFVRESPHNFLAVKVGDVVPEAPDLFDVLVLLAPSEEVAEQVCQHFVHCFQFLYREAIAAMEQLQLQEEADLEQLELAKKFVPASSASVSLCSSPISASCQRLAGSPSDDHPPIARCANSTSTSSNSTRQAVELINEYLTMLSACLSHDELNKFAILMRRWRARQMPILEFAQKLLELYGPERRYLLARMRSLLRGDPADLEALSDFLRANGVVENAAAGLGGSPPLTAEMSLGSGEHQAMAGSCPPSASSSSFQAQSSLLLGLLPTSLAVATTHHSRPRSS